MGSGTIAPDCGRRLSSAVKSLVAAALATAVLCSAARAGNGTLHPPLPVLQSLQRLHEIGSLDGLPADIRRGHFALPDGTKAPGWTLASPGGAWNATDSIIDPSLPGRRLIFAACDATICLLHYERGGIALIDLVMSLTRERDGWKATWLAYGHPPAKNLDALRALLQNRSTLLYHDDTNTRIDY
jgi:hypothetical protein